MISVPKPLYYAPLSIKRNHQFTTTVTPTTKSMAYSQEMYSGKVFFSFISQCIYAILLIGLYFQLISCLAL